MSEDVAPQRVAIDDGTNVEVVAIDSSQAIMEWLARERKPEFETRADVEQTPDLRGANLSGVQIVGDFDLSGIDMSEADLTSAALIGLSVNGSNLTNAVLTDAQFAGSDFTGVILDNAVVKGSRFLNPPVIGLTQSQLDSARIDKGGPLDLDELVDPITGVHLRWPG